MANSPAPNLHMPRPSLWPLVLAIGLTMIMAGVISTLWVSLLGLGLLLIAIWRWTQENREVDPQEGGNEEYRPAMAPVAERDNPKLGIWVFLGSEAVFFLALILTNVYIRLHDPAGYALARPFLDIPR